MIAYTVTAEFDTPTLRDEWIAWLRDTHLADVIAAGAADAELIRLDSEPCRAEVRYHFDSRESFTRYERDHAPRLRAEGIRLFPPDRGMRVSRSLGESLLTLIGE